MILVPVVEGYAWVVYCNFFQFFSKNRMHQVPHAPRIPWMSVAMYNVQVTTQFTIYRITGRDETKTSKITVDYSTHSGAAKHKEWQEMDVLCM